ncbi:MAG: hypothetical protein GY874_15905 [Desulfobacteraceae bacterium]|nr:hypothetical protein [Desulfobacteraceae bacterium]
MKGIGTEQQTCSTDFISSGAAKSHNINKLNDTKTDTVTAPRAASSSPENSVNEMAPHLLRCSAQIPTEFAGDKTFQNENELSQVWDNLPTPKIKEENGVPIHDPEEETHFNFYSDDSDDDGDDDVSQNNLELKHEHSLNQSDSNNIYPAKGIICHEFGDIENELKNRKLKRYKEKTQTNENATYEHKKIETKNYATI